MKLSIKRIKKALISLRGSAGWSAPLLFANTEDMVSRVEVHLLLWSWNAKTKLDKIIKA